MLRIIRFPLAFGGLLCRDITGRSGGSLWRLFWRSSWRSWVRAAKTRASQIWLKILHVKSSSGNIYGPSTHSPLPRPPPARAPRRCAR